MRTLQNAGRGVVMIVAIALTLGLSGANASSLTFTCDTASSVVNPDTYASGTCAYLNSTIANLYTSTFTNLNANIYVEQSTTAALGSSNSGYVSVLSYSNYLFHLTSSAGTNAIDTAAIAAMNAIDTPVYNAGAASNVVVPTALASALGITHLTGTTATGLACSIGRAGCYNGIIYISTPDNLASGSPDPNNPQTLYWRQNGGTIGQNSYDYYTIVEHETNEILGTTSCMSTVSTTLALQNACALIGPSTVTAVDLFRYNGAGVLAVSSNYLGQTSAPNGAYFSYDGGVTNGAAGAVYNTASNGLDYADFIPTCTFIQDASGCLGQSVDITNDGGAEINILDAIGYNTINGNTSNVSSTPEPGTLVLFGAGLICIACRRRFSALISR